MLIKLIVAETIYLLYNTRDKKEHFLITHGFCIQT